MLIVDAQVQIRSQGTPCGQHRQISSYTAEDCLKEMGEGGVDAAVLYPPSWDPSDMEVAAEAACQYPNGFAILGRFPQDSRRAGRKPEEPAEHGRAALFFLQPHLQNWLTDGAMDWLWPAAERAQIPIALMASNHLPAVGRITEPRPSLRLLIDRFGRLRGTTDDAAHTNQPALLALAKYPNVAVKNDRAPGNSSQPDLYRNIHKYIQQIYGMFSSQRMFRGTNIIRTPCSRRQCVTMFTAELPPLEGRDLKLVMGRAVCDWIGWTLSG